MIAALLTVIGLFIAFYEKIELFRKPITFTKVSIILLLIVSAIISFIKDANSEYEQAHNTEVIDKLNAKSTALTEQVSYLRKENKQTNKEYVDSIVSYHNYTTELLARYGLKVDTLANAVKLFDTSTHKEVQPTLAIFNVPTFIRNNNENLIAYDLNALNSDVHLVQYYYAIINTKTDLHNTQIITKDTPMLIPGEANFTTIVPVGAPFGLNIFIDRIKRQLPITDTFYLAMEFLYKSKDNKIQTPVRKVYRVSLKELKVSDTSSEEFYVVALYLKKYKIWRKFYYL